MRPEDGKDSKRLLYSRQSDHYERGLTGPPPTCRSLARWQARKGDGVREDNEERRKPSLAGGRSCFCPPARTPEASPRQRKEKTLGPGRVWAQFGDKSGQHSLGRVVSVNCYSPQFSVSGAATRTVRADLKPIRR